MGLAAASSTKDVKPFAVRRNVEQRILQFSLCIGAISTLIAAMADAIALRSDLRDPQTVNIEALAEMHCDGDACDTSAFATDPYTESPDCVVDAATRFFLRTPGSAPDTATRLASLDLVWMKVHQKRLLDMEKSESWRSRCASSPPPTRK